MWQIRKNVTVYEGSIELCNSTEDRCLMEINMQMNIVNSIVVHFKIQEDTLVEKEGERCKTKCVIRIVITGLEHFLNLNMSASQDSSFFERTKALYRMYLSDKKKRRTIQ